MEGAGAGGYLTMLILSEAQVNRRKQLQAYAGSSFSPATEFRDPLLSEGELLSRLSAYWLQNFSPEQAILWMQFSAGKSYADIYCESRERQRNNSSARSTIPIQAVPEPYQFGVFTTILIRNDVPLFLEEHLERLFENAQEASIPVLGQKDALQKRLALFLRENEALGNQVPEKGRPNSKVQEYGLRIVLDNSFLRHEETTIDNHLLLLPFTFYHPKKLYSAGASLVPYFEVREHSHLKALYWQKSLAAESYARDQRADEALLVHPSTKEVTECARGNIFYVRQGIVKTPIAGMLPGITRKKVIELALENSIPVEEDIVYYEDLRNASEVFLTGTTKRIVPVTSVDGKTIGDGSAGEITQKLATAYSRLIQSQTEPRT